MEKRCDITAKAQGTCDWILTNSNYLEWLDKGGLLWIKGRPGTGKSTMMASILTVAASRTSKTKLTASFSFHKRREMLQRSPLGLFRSLLHQILSHDPTLLSEFCEISQFEQKRDQKGRPGTQWHLTEPELRHYLIEIIRRFTKKKSLCLHIDALDESGEVAARDLLSYFGELRHKVSEPLSICLSCRPWPNVVSKWDYCITMEEENNRDIVTYLKNTFSESSTWTDLSDLGEIQEQIAARALGVFQWVVLVTKRILTLQNETKSYVLEEISKIPQELSDLYEDMLAQLQGTDRELALRIMLWITFAAEPLTLEELRVAIASGAEETHKSFEDLKASKHWCENDTKMEQRVLRLSRGLARVVNPTLDYRPVVQFDHESVRDYMVARGILSLEKDKASAMQGDLVGRAHHFMLTSCLNYMNIDGSGFVGQPFWCYVERHHRHHARIAEAQGISQTDIIYQTEWPSSKVWSKLTHIESQARYIRQWKDPENQPDDHCRSTLQHFACRCGLYSVMTELIPLCKKSQPSSGDETKVKVRKGPNGFRRRKERPLIGLDEIDADDDQLNSPLSIAADQGDVRITRLLLDTRSVNVESSSKDGSTPLLYAIQGGHTEVVELLLASGNIDLNHARYDGTTPLIAAIKLRDETLVKVLIDTKRVNLNQRNRDLETPLFVAQERGCKAAMKLLLATGKAKSDPWKRKLLTSFTYGSWLDDAIPTI